MDDKTCSNCGKKLTAFAGTAYCSYCLTASLNESTIWTKRSPYDYYDRGPKFVMPIGVDNLIINPDVLFPTAPKPEPPKPTRKQLMRDLSAAIKRTYEQLDEKKDSRDEAMYWCFGNPISMKRKAKPYDTEIERLENEIDEMEHRYAILRDTLDEGIDDAAARDGTAAFLLDY